MKPTERFTDLDPQKEMNGMQEKCRMLDKMNNEYKPLLLASADAKMVYDEAYAVALAKERINGTAMSIIKEEAKNKIIKLNYEVIITEAGVKANRQTMANLKTQIDAYRSRIAWLKAEYFRVE